jgi:septum site-determining protein MinC
VRNGIKIYIDSDYSSEDILDTLKRKIEAGKRFFQGSEINLTFTGKKLTAGEQQAIIELVSREINIGSITFDIGKTVYSDPEPVEFFDGIEEGITRFVRGTIRSGQLVSYRGNVVIIGDVNPGGEIIAEGNIVVMGTLRGMAHAGAGGNNKAVVVAFSLQPTQLRIGTVIARPPEGEVVKALYPEIAYVRDGNLVIEPYLPNKGR